MHSFKSYASPSCLQGIFEYSKSVKSLVMLVATKTVFLFHELSTVMEREVFIGTT